LVENGDFLIPSFYITTPWGKRFAVYFTPKPDPGQPSWYKWTEKSPWTVDETERQTDG